MDNTIKHFSLPSPAKINRFLHITGRRKDGYHNLQTLFQFLDYGDSLRFTKRDDNLIKLYPDTLLGIPNETNLIYRAAKLLQQTANIPLGVTIEIQKRLPLGAGLGGGSSNAATTLFALNILWQRHLPLTRLIALGATLGADIPIFLYGHSAFAEGTGDQFTPIDCESPWILVITPPCQVNTAKMFAHTDLTRDTPRLRIRALDWLQLGNDFEPLVRKLYPEVDAAMKWLSRYSTARLSGSGASVFACFNSRQQAEETLALLKQPFTGLVAKAVNISPLHKKADELGFLLDGVSPSGKAQGFDPCIPRFES